MIHGHKYTDWISELESNFFYDNTAQKALVNSGLDAWSLIAQMNVEVERDRHRDPARWG